MLFTNEHRGEEKAYRQKKKITMTVSARLPADVLHGWIMQRLTDTYDNDSRYQIYSWIKLANLEVAHLFLSISSEQYEESIKRNQLWRLITKKTHTKPWKKMKDLTKSPISSFHSSWQFQNIKIENYVTSLSSMGGIVVHGVSRCNKYIGWDMIFQTRNTNKEPKRNTDRAIEEGGDWDCTMEINIWNT